MDMDIDIKEYTNDLVNALKNLDINDFKKFYRKYEKLGVFSDDKLPDNDFVTEISLNKIAANCTKLPYSTRKKAKKWLHERNFDESFY